LEHETPIVKKEKLESGTVENIVNPPESEEQKEATVDKEVARVQPAQTETKETVQKNKALEKPKAEFYFTSGGQFLQGHTGYLTFATKI